jgi:hypothetical protein
MLAMKVDLLLEEDNNNMIFKYKTIATKIIKISLRFLLVMDKMRARKNMSLFNPQTSL